MPPTDTQPLALIVDDELTNRLILRSLLKKQGYESVEAVNGHEAVEIFRKRQPDIIFMDIMMPEMDGYEATRIIKAEAGNRFVPVIFLTAVTDEESLLACIDAGGDDFLLKPYDQFLLQSKVRAMERIANLNREIRGMYSLIHREQEIAEQVFNNAVLKNNIENPFIRSIIRPAGTFSGDMILSDYSPSRDIHFLIGDFTGHGLSAALGAMPVSEVFHAMTAKGFTPEEILGGINKKLRQFLPVGMFLGVQLISISHDLESVSIFNCGMPDLLIIDGQSRQIKHHARSTGLPLGVVDQLNAREIRQTLPLSEGDHILMYSDGVTEAWSEDEEEFGIERLKQAITGAGEGGIFDSILHSLESFCGDREQADDITLIKITIDKGLLPKLQEHEAVAPSSHKPKTNGDWEYIFSLKDQRLRETNPVPLIINHIMEMESVENERQSLFTVLTELYVNALDHGVLGLDSALKADPAGFALYFQEREKRLSELSKGQVTFHLSVEQEDGSRRLRLTIEDSGPGFDFQVLEQKPVEQTGLCGRGILLVRDLCDHLEYLGKGNIASVTYSWKTLS